MLQYAESPFSQSWHDCVISKPLRVTDEFCPKVSGTIALCPMVCDNKKVYYCVKE